MIILIVLGTLFLTAAISGIINGDMLAFYACFFWSIVFYTLIFYVKREQKKSKEFIDWINDNKYYIEQGLAQYDGRDISLDTKITWHVFCVSALFFSKIFHTRVVLVGTFEAIIARIVNTLLTLLFGWWAIPRGPIYTVILTIKNVTGGNKMTVKALMEKLEEEDSGIDFRQTEEYQKIQEYRYRGEL